MKTEEKIWLKALEESIDKFNSNRNADNFYNVVESTVEYCAGDFDNIYVPIKKPIKESTTDKEIKCSIRNGFYIYSVDDLDEFDLIILTINNKNYIPVFTSEYYEDLKNTDSLVEISCYKLLRIANEDKESYSGLALNPEFADSQGVLLNQNDIEFALHYISDIVEWIDEANIGFRVVSEKVLDKCADIVLDVSKVSIIDEIDEINKEVENKKIGIDFSKIEINANDSKLIELVAGITYVCGNRNKFLFNVKDINDKETLEFIISNIVENHNDGYLNKLRSKYD